MPSQHGDGWSARWTDHEGKRRRTTFRFKRDAEAYERKMKGEQEEIRRGLRAGDLATLFEPLAKTLEAAVPTIRKLLEERAREEERRQKEWEEQKKRWRREEEERRQKEEEAARVNHIQEAFGSWRMARDLPAYVAEIRALVKDADLKITEGGGPDEELKWALKYADRIDPLSTWRQDIAKVKAKLVSQPCPDCGKIHGADETDADEGDDADGAPSESGDASETEPGPDVA